jgi:hypothetical protein
VEQSGDCRYNCPSIRVPGLFRDAVPPSFAITAITAIRP